MMHHLFRGLAISLACLSMACSKQASTRGASVKMEHSWTPAPEIGSLNQDGRLIFWTIDAFDHIEPFVLLDEYGVVLFNAGDNENPEPRYIVASQESRSVLITADFEQFRRELQRIPKGTLVGRYDTCSVPRSYGLPDDAIARFQAALGEAGLKVESEGDSKDRHVCYCPKHG